MEKQELQKQLIMPAMPVIEAEHRILFALCRQYYEEVRTEGKRGPLIELLDEIMDRTRLHFAHEEAVLTKRAYPGYAVHRLAHRQILTDFVSLQLALKGTQELVHKDTQHVLDALLIHHVREDAKIPKQWRR